MRFALILVAAVGFAMWWGGHTVYLGFRNRAPVEVSCADYLKQRPDAEWLRLTHCAPDFEQTAFESSTSGSVTKVYVPLRPDGVTTGAMKIIVERDDDEMKQLANKLKGATEISDDTGKRLGAAFAGPIEGTVQIGLDLSESRQEELAKLDLGLDKDFVILEYGTTPVSMVYGLAALAGGLLGLGLVVRTFIRRRRPAAQPA